MRWWIVSAMAAMMAASGARAEPAGGASLEEAIFAGGCFWCVEHAFDEVDGVVETVSGYTGGDAPAPTYEQVSSGGTGHVEAVLVRFDPARVSYARLLDVFWHNIDPTQANGQFCDIGSQYRAVIFWRDEAQRAAAEQSLAQLRREAPFGDRIATEILPAGRFWPAEAYHQDYHRRNPIRYRFYRYNCGRDQRLAEIWGER